MRKLLFTGVLLSLLLANSAFAEPAGFVDLSKYYPADIEGHWADDTMTDFLQSGVLEGYAGEDRTVTVKPDLPITRAEFVTLLFRGNEMGNGSMNKSFSDVQPGDWYYDAVRKASSLGIVDGFEDGSFAPGKNITRSEISAILVRTYQTTVSFDGQAKAFTDTSDHWAKSFIDKASAAAIVNGYDDGTFKPGANAKRAEAMTMLSRALHKEAGALPDDAALTQIVQSGNDAVYDALSKKQYDLLDPIVSKFGKGFYRDSSLAAAQALEMLKEQGFDVQLKMKGTPAYAVLSKSDRYAAVSIKDFQLEITYSNGEFSETETTPADDIVFLQKMNGKWFVYGSKNDYERLKQY